MKQKLQSVDNKKIIVPAKKLTFFLKDPLKVIEQEILFEDESQRENIWT